MDSMGTSSFTINGTGLRFYGGTHTIPVGSNWEGTLVNSFASTLALPDTFILTDRGTNNYCS